MMVFYDTLLIIWSMTLRISAPFFIFFRLRKGLEDPIRYKERYGISKTYRPSGDLIWFHGASVGESLSLLPLIQKVLEQKPNAHILITTTTTAAQRVISSRMTSSMIHQFIPFDSISWVEKFLDYWHPSSAFFVESEIWPNILKQLKLRNIPTTLLNARLSDKSLRNWLRVKNITKHLWGAFSAIYTQSDSFTKRFHELGAKNAKTLGNIKLLSNTLPFHEAELMHWKNQIGNRICWVVASTHQGEEEIIFNVHQELKKDFPSLLTIIAPRHIDRCPDIVARANNLEIARFSDHILQNEDILLVDAMGKLGVFYRLTSIAFIGGSLMPIGGHNPLEPAMVGAFPLWGPHFFNVEDMMYLFDGMPCKQMDSDQLVSALKNMLSNSKKTESLVEELQQRINDSQQRINQKINEIISAS